MNILHLFSNVFAILIFGSILERIIGSKKFLTIFFLSGFISSIADIIFYESTAGASGAVFGILGCLALIRPKTVVWVLGVPMYIIIAIFLWLFLDFAGIFLADNIAHWSHIYGLGTGIMYGLWIRERFREKNEENLKDSDLPDEREIEKWEEKYMLRKF